MTDHRSTVARPTPEQVRDEFVAMLRNDWLGPAGGPHEIVPEKTVRDRYLVGGLAPKDRFAGKAKENGEDEFAIPIDEQGDLPVGGGDEDGPPDATIPEIGDTAAFIPSSIGVTASLDKDADQVMIRVRYGQYRVVRDHEDEYEALQASAPNVRHWRRIPIEVEFGPFPVQEGRIGPVSTQPSDPENKAITVVGECRRVRGGFIVTVFLVNGQKERARSKDEGWIFQPEIALYHPDGAAIFSKRPMPRGLHDQEDRVMEMLYRRHPQFAVGHGVGVHITRTDDRPTRATQVETRVIPAHMLPPMAARHIEGLVVDMARLADIPCGGFAQALAPLTEAYAAWLDARAAEVADPDALLRPFVEDEHGTAGKQIVAGRAALRRIRAGIALLDRDPQAAQAFQFANAAMRDQRVRSLFAEQVRRGEQPDVNDLDIPANRSWRPFQLAFILLNLPALVDPTHADRSTPNPLDAPADLLWFPTGGGKTEAYLGLTAFTLAIRRLQRDLGGFDGEGGGVAVLMRYTLRLLTIQQFQRAAALICACEVIRRDDPTAWGSEPFRIGLWVGASSTPNSTEDSAVIVNKARRGELYGSSGTPLQLKTCPWCGSEIKPGKNVVVELFEQGAGRTLQYCGDTMGECPFGNRRSEGEGIPIVVVDEEIYRRLPALLIATVDKFAQMPWKGETQMLFGRVTGWCPRHGYRSPDLHDSDSHPKKGSLVACRTVPFAHGLRPPDLIIQDELHLISGPLGTLVGLYETAVDNLCSWTLNGATVRPKIVASTATIRRAGQQVRGLFERHVAVFPPSGLDANDNFFAFQDNEAPGRLYLGLCASGTRLKSVLIRAYVTVMAASQTLFNRYGALADPYMTLVGYFNSIRELGGMVRVMDDAVQSRLRRMEKRGLADRKIFPQDVEELTSRQPAGRIPDILARLETPFGTTEDKRYPLHTVLATNMISVGVDVARLGCMVVAGQPKATAEYIQATSRVGRRAPGVVVTVYQWTRPRDLSHYERFEDYHATFYQQVEALSVTPFAPRAIDRALVAVFVSLMRLTGPVLNPDVSAGALRSSDPLLDHTMTQIMARAAHVVGHAEAHEQVQALLQEARQDWLKRIRQIEGGGRLTYATKQGAQVNLLTKPQSYLGDRDLFTALNSMRDVEAPIKLILDDYNMDRIEDS